LSIIITQYNVTEVDDMILKIQYGEKEGTISIGVSQVMKLLTTRAFSYLIMSLIVCTPFAIGEYYHQLSENLLWYALIPFCVVMAIVGVYAPQWSPAEVLGANLSGSILAELFDDPYYYEQLTFKEKVQLFESVSELHFK
jgi:hypothetical protein